MSKWSRMNFTGMANSSKCSRTSVAKITEAFLDTDLGLNLYKDIDEWLVDFEKKQYVYELSWQENKNIAKNVNKILENELIWDCLIDWVTEEIIASIVEWKINILY